MGAWWLTAAVILATLIMVCCDSSLMYHGVTYSMISAKMVLGKDWRTLYIKNRNTKYDIVQKFGRVDYRDRRYGIFQKRYSI